MKKHEVFSKEDLNRLQYLQMAVAGHIKLKEAADRMTISYRHAKRLKKHFLKKGIKALVHGNTGKKSGKATGEDLQRRIVNLAQTLYKDLNITHLAERLQEEQHICVSRETVRKILKNTGIQTASARRSRRVKPFLLASREGKNVFWGGITGQWFPKPHPRCCFMAAIDTATLKCLAARFFPEESSGGYLWLLKKMLDSYGIPEALCQHSMNAIKMTSSRLSIKEELRGGKAPSQVARAMHSLGIVPSCEQKRHVRNIVMSLRQQLQEEIKRAGVKYILEGNSLLEHEFIFAYNRRYAFSDEGLRKAWRKVPSGVDSDRICSHYYEALVDPFNTVRVSGVEIQVPPGPGRISYAMAGVEVRRLLNGVWHVYYKDRRIAVHVPPVFDAGFLNEYLALNVNPARQCMMNRQYAARRRAQPCRQY